MVDLATPLREIEVRPAPDLLGWRCCRCGAAIPDERVERLRLGFPAVPDAELEAAAACFACLTASARNCATCGVKIEGARVLRVEALIHLGRLPADTKIRCVSCFRGRR